MKNYFLLLCLTFANVLYSQDFSVKVEPQIDNNELVLDFMVIRHSSTPFAFRSSNFSIFLNSSALNLSARYVDHAFDGPWDDGNNATNYFDLSVGGGIDYITFNINSIFNSPGSGTNLPMAWTRIGRVRVPITDPTSCTNYSWRLGPMSVRDWGGNNIKPLGDWIEGTACIPLCVAPLTPLLTSSQSIICPQQSVSLTSDQMGTHEWTYNSTILTDTLNTIQAFLPGTYKVRSKVNGCYSIFSNEIVLNQSSDTLFNILASDSIICESTSNQFNANPTFTNYQWVYNGNTISITNTCFYSQAGKYYVTAFNSDNCMLTDSIEILNNASVFASITAIEDSVCPNQNVVLNGNSVVGEGKWRIVNHAGVQEMIQDSLVLMADLADLGQYIYVQFISTALCDSVVLEDSIFVRNEILNPVIQNIDSICFNSTLTLNVINSNQGYWTVIQGNGQISDTTLSTTNYQVHSSDSILIFSWKEEGMCSYSIVYDTVFVKPDLIFSDQLLIPDFSCDSIINIQALNTLEPGTWTIISGSGSIQNSTSATTNYLATPSDIHQQIILQWTQTSDCELVNLIDSFIYLPSSPVPVISQNGNQLMVSNYLNGQWFLNGQLLQDSISHVITPSQPGIYSFGALGLCDSVYSDTISFIISNIAILQESQIVIYPNPSTDEMFVEGIQEFTEIRLLDLQGKLIFSSSYPSGFSLKKSDLKISSGTFILNIKTKTKELSKLVVWY